MIEFIDIGCDVGEGFGVYSYGYDQEVMELITSANIACGFHAGDPVIMRETIDLAAGLGVAVGAHPGLPDLLGFGRRPMKAPVQDLCDYVIYQIGALEAFCRLAGVKIEHVKFHGALARMSAEDRGLAAALATRIRSYSKDLILVASAGSALEEAGIELGLTVASEVLVDRGYDSAGRLIPVRDPGGVVSDPQRVLEQVEEVVARSRVKTGGGYMPLQQVHTLGFHYGTTGIETVREIHRSLKMMGTKVMPVGRFPGGPS